MKKLKNILLSILFLFTFMPNIYAYSDYLIVSGKSVGIQINLDGILVVGTYSVNNKNINDLKLGDRIIKIDNTYVNSIKEMTSLIYDKVNITYIRNNKEYTTTLNVVNENGINKTGLYVKDEITGVGTLTFIDPETNLYGALGHEIIDRNTKKIVDITNGSIYKSNIIDITKGNNEKAGNVNATYNSDIVYGTINKNTISGIYGVYNTNYDNNKLYKIASVKDIKLGNAKILTTLDDNIVKEYDIYIEKLYNGDIKNILFKVTDEELLNKTGGIVQGMSGSPIIQDGYIIGAVTHVIVDDSSKGYGIYITNMLKELE